MPGSVVRPRAQHGVALIVALVMLLVIGFTSVAIMRTALNADLVANNVRVQHLAWQAAQLGLRYCESQIGLDPADRTITVFPAPAVDARYRWEDFSSWWGGGVLAAEVPVVWGPSDAAGPAKGRPPQCLVEAARQPGEQTYVVTSRGFSPDYSPDSRGQAHTGSVVWLQSTVALGSANPP